MKVLDLCCRKGLAPPLDPPQRDTDSLIIIGICINYIFNNIFQNGTNALCLTAEAHAHITAHHKTIEEIHKVIFLSILMFHIRAHPAKLAEISA